MRRALAAAVALVPTLAYAEPGTKTTATAIAPAASAPAPVLDLRLRHAPTRLHMRVKVQAPVTTAQVTKPPGDTAAPAPAAGSADASASATVDNQYHPLPTDLRDAHERVIFKVNAGYQLDSAPASGETLRGGQPLVPGFAGQRNWILGDAVVGTRDVLLPSLNSYFLASYQFDTGDTLASRTATIVPGDATDQRVAIKAGYAEYGTEDKDNNHLWLRAGRQYRQDGGSMFAYFDGATLGYRDSGWSVSAFGGQRVALYIDTPNGTLFGATASLDLKKLKDVPVKVGVDYEGLSISSLDPTDPTQLTTQNQVRQLIAAYGNVDLGKRAHLDLKVRVVDAGANDGIDLGVPGAGVAPSTGGLAFGRASAHLRVSASNDVMIVADLQQRGAGDLAYDLAAPSSVDVTNLARQLGVGLYQPVDATLAGVQADYRHQNVELLGFARVNATEGTVVTADQEGYAEAGAAIAGSPVMNTWITGQYTFRDYFLSDGTTTTANNMAVSAFGDTSSTGLSSMHELALDGWWRNSSREHKLRLGGGLFYRVYNLATPYVTTSDDGRGGGRADVQFWLTQELHVQLAGEIAQADPTLMREIGTMASIRAAVEARW